MMRLMDYLHWQDVTVASLNFYKAIGIESLMVHLPERMGDGQDHTDELTNMRKFVEDQGLELFVYHAHQLPRDNIIHGRPGRDEQIDNWIKVLRAIGASGVSTTTTTFYAISHFRTGSTYGRGGISYSSFNYEKHLKDPPPNDPELAISEERLWENLEYFLRRVVPVAEEVGVRIAFHPDDPPIPEPLGGAARIMVSIENFQRVFDLVPSDAYGMLFCQGCVAEMGEDVLQAIRAVGERGKIIFVHFRNIRGGPYDFEEVFLDEGDMDMVAAMKVYRDVGFDGPIMMDHTPGVPSDPSGMGSRSYSNGYIKALIQAVCR
jgi:mannonate dehydratase